MSRAWPPYARARAGSFSRLVVCDGLARRSPAVAPSPTLLASLRTKVMQSGGRGARMHRACWERTCATRGAVWVARLRGEGRAFNRHESRPFEMGLAVSADVINVYMYCISPVWLITMYSEQRDRMAKTVGWFCCEMCKPVACCTRKPDH